MIVPRRYQGSVIVGIGHGARHAHDSSAAILVDGRLVAASEEERFSRRRHDTAFPERALAFCLRAAGVEPGDVDAVGVSADPWAALPQRLAWAVRSLGSGTWRWALPWMISLTRSALNSRALARRLFPRARVYSVEHHAAHAASAFFCSPFERAAVLTLDGRGEWATATMGEGKGAAVSRLRAAHYPDSIGILYLALTEYLGFRFGDEYKVMGLSSYGTPVHEELVRESLRFDSRAMLVMGRGWYVNPLAVGRRRGRYGEAFERLFGAPRAADELVQPRHADIASSFQRHVERVGVRVARELLELTGCRKLVLAGGVCLNGLMNQRIIEELGLAEGDVFIQPAADDGGLSLGAALFVRHQILGAPRDWTMDHAYWGEGFDDARIARAVRKSGLPARPLADPAAETAALLARNRIVGWYQGRSEWGPRALGNRSILADPRDAANRDRVNASIKFREEFRPFAPSILESRAALYFDNLSRSPYMLRIARVRADARGRIPAVTHVDGTARPQTVTADSAPAYARLIGEFERLTGVPVVLNTSMNLRNEPIVNTPEEAVACLKRSGLDALVMGGVLLERSGVPVC